jgi:hypothetical protein
MQEPPDVGAVPVQYESAQSEANRQDRVQTGVLPHAGFDEDAGGHHYGGRDGSQADITGA